MKNRYQLVVMLLFTAFVQAQKIKFEYDAAGNQILREYVFTAKQAPSEEPPKEIAQLQEEDFQTFAPEDEISFYPNPVKEELYLRWELTNNKKVALISLFDLNGKKLQSYSRFTQENTLNIPFYNYPLGTYLVVMEYTGGEIKTIKIVKN